MGAKVTQDKLDIYVEPSEMDSIDVEVPGDISSAAFWMIAEICKYDSELLLKNVGINKTRSGIITILKKMNAKIEILNKKDVASEPIADIYVRTSDLGSEDFIWRYNTIID